MRKPGAGRLEDHGRRSLPNRVWLPYPCAPAGGRAVISTEALLLSRRCTCIIFCPRLFKMFIAQAGTRGNVYLPIYIFLYSFCWLALVCLFSNRRKSSPVRVSRGVGERLVVCLP